MQQFNRTVCIIVCLLLSTSALSRELLSWSQAVSETLARNPELKAVQERQRAAKAEIREAESKYYPEIKSTVSYDYGRRFNEVKAGDNFSASLSLSYPIFTGFRDQALVRQAELQWELSRIEEQSIRARLSFELKSAFVGLVYAQQALALQDAIIRRRAENLSLVRLRFEGGLENMGSVLLSEAYLKEAEFERLQALQRIEVAQSQLARILGRDDEARFQAEGQVPIKQPSQQVEYHELIRNNPEFFKIQVEESLAKNAVTVANSGYYPTLSLSSDLNRRDSYFFPQNDQWSVGVSVSYPLFSGGKDVAATAAARASHSAAISARENLNRDLLARLKQAHTNLLASDERLKVSSSFREAAQIRAEIARTKYNNGLISFEEWDRIETDLINREQSHLVNERDRVTTEAAWEQAQGVGVLK